MYRIRHDGKCRHDTQYFAGICVRQFDYFPAPMTVDYFLTSRNRKWRHMCVTQTGDAGDFYASTFVISWQCNTHGTTLSMSDKYDSVNEHIHPWDQRINEITYSRGVAKCPWILLGNWQLLANISHDGRLNDIAMPKPEIKSRVFSAVPFLPFLFCLPFPFPPSSPLLPLFLPPFPLAVQQSLKSS